MAFKVGDQTYYEEVRWGQTGKSLKSSAFPNGELKSRHARGLLLAWCEATLAGSKLHLEPYTGKIPDRAREIKGEKLEFCISTEAEASGSPAAWTLLSILDENNRVSSILWPVSSTAEDAKSRISKVSRPIAALARKL